MSSANPLLPPEVHIERLVLDIPGFDPAQARSLALQVADGLARAGITAERKSVYITLGNANSDLTGQIVVALIERLA